MWNGPCAGHGREHYAAGKKNGVAAFLEMGEVSAEKSTNLSV